MEYDYVVIGSGGAGLYTALKAQEHGRVLLLTKGALGGGSTSLAQGGIAAAIGPEDSAELHRRDTMLAGKGLCNPRAVGVLVKDAARCIDDLIHLGVPFDYEGDEIALGLEGAHSVPRVLHAGGDATGFMLQQVLSHKIEYLDRITVLDEHLVTELVVVDGVCQGVRALDINTGSISEHAGRFTVLATGGFGQLFAHTTNSKGATGDGIAVAFRAGADIADMEFFQFHPTVLFLPHEHSFLISEAVRGEGAILRDANGRAFMKDYDPRGGLAPRDIVSRAILKEMQKSGKPCVYLDITHKSEERLKVRFPSIYRHCIEQGIDMAHDMIPVAPAAHYAIGGIKTNLWGETTIVNLFACGEVACTGVHGANRLASNSLLELLVFGQRVVKRTTDPSVLKAPESGSPSGAGEELPDLLIEMAPYTSSQRQSVPPTIRGIQSLAWEKLGVTRHGDSLDEARKTFGEWQSSQPQPAKLPDHELSNLLLVGRLVAEAASTRRESRGTHYRVDFPQESTEWLRHIVLHRKTHD